MGVDVLLVGPLPTPGIAFITRSLRADAGVVISASHNPYDDNGVKFFSGDGLKLPDALERKIEGLIFSGEVDGIRAAPREIGKAYRINDAVGRYIEFAKNSFPKGMTLKGMRIVVDCANGAAYKVSPTVLKELNADVMPINVQPDGTNINKGCGSLHPEALRRAVLKQKAHVGFAHDGDADRVLFVDERGALVDGDHILALCALDLKAEGRLHEDTVVATVMSNLGFEVAMREAGIKVVRTAVGDRYVLEEMLANRYTLGGEQSGHIIFLDHNTTGDGIVTALQVLAIMRKQGKRLSDLSACMTSYPQVLVNVPVRRRSALEQLPRLQEGVRSVEARLGSTGRVLVRLSGTEPVARVMIEGQEHGTIERLARELALMIEKELG
jgi:phosphoglucosamine mutase